MLSFWRFIRWPAKLNKRRGRGDGTLGARHSSVKASTSPQCLWRGSPQEGFRRNLGAALSAIGPVGLALIWRAQVFRLFVKVNEILMYTVDAFVWKFYCYTAYHVSNTRFIYDWDRNYSYSVHEGNVLFNDALNTFYLRLYGVGECTR